jgi:ABC-2 type transport system ATP-binding protein
MQSIIETNVYLQNKDWQIANRRLLDLAYQTQDEALIRQGIQHSKTLNANIDNEAAIQAWHQQSLTMLDVIEKKQIQPANAIQLVKASNISKKYKQGNFGISELNVQLNAQEILGVVGENGNGKTSLLRCLAGQLQIDSGTLDYPFLNQYDNYTLKSEIAFIPQRIPRWYGLLKDNLHFSASIHKSKAAQNNLMVDFMLERFNLSAYANLTWQQISSGYRTRFEIARILLQKPKLLILDEPLANLDIKAQQTLLTDLRMLAKNSSLSMGIILSSQQLHEVEKVADHVMMIRSGKQLQTHNNSVLETGISVVEIETDANAQQLQNLLGQDIKITFNGSFYTLSTSQLDANIILQKLARQITITYFRDISNSTKRFF